MKIGVKITLLAAVAVLGIGVIFYLSYSSLDELDNMFTDIGNRPLKNLILASQISDEVNLLARQSALICFDKHENLQSRFDITAQAVAAASKYVDSLAGNARAPEMVELIKQLQKAMADQQPVRVEFRRLLSANQMERAQEYRLHEYSDAITRVTDLAVQIQSFATEQANEACFVTSTAHVGEALAFLILVAIVVLIIAVILSFVIITGITKPLRRAVEAANKVAEGDLKVDLTTNSKDELGELMHSLEEMVDSIGTLIKDTDELSTAAINGKLEVRADTAGHKGAFKELITGVNKTLDAVIGPLNVTAEYVDRISKGDMPPKITDTYNGDFNEIKNNLNGCMDAINLLVSEINQSIHKAIDGDFKYRADANKFRGDFKKMIEGVNELVSTFVEPLEMSSSFLQAVAIGDNAAMPQITKDYKGEFNTIKNAINKVRDTLFFVLEEMSSAANAANQGDLNKKADAAKMQGGWKVIMDGLNSITAAANAIITDAGAVLSTMATGDLTPRVKKDYPGKFGEMKKDINNLGDSLTDLISRLTEAIHTTAASSAEISATAETIATATQEQASQTEEVASSVEQMSRTVTDNAHSATKTADVAKKSGDTANHGGKVVQHTVEKMREISSVVQSSAQNIAKLGESSKKIGEIIGVIDDIADQTNLLSLNAAIEAARAGEQGRGFAVVADSVGKLAISTASATKEIAEMIKGIQSDTEAAVRAMERGTSEVQSGIELADTAGTSIKDIVTGIDELLDMVNQIAAASEQQSVTSETISKNVSSISRVTAESARNIEDVAATANELAKMTETLTSLVSQFKVEESGSRRNLSPSNGSSYSTSSDNSHSSSDDDNYQSATTATSSNSKYLN